MKFDIIIGNPPYNKGGVGRKGHKNLDEHFVIKALEYLKPNGYLLFIIKTTIRGVLSIGYKHIIEKRLLYSKVFDFNKAFNQNVMTNYLLIQNTDKCLTDLTTFEYNGIIKKGFTKNGMNIYFLPLEELRLNDLTKYGSLEKITRGTKIITDKYLLIRHSTNEIKIVNEITWKTDKWYIIPNPSTKTIMFFNNYYPVMRKYGLFNGFSTSKSLFYNIPNYNIIV